MLKSYLTYAIRGLFKRKLYSFINIFGLATGVAVCLVILKYVDFELNYDSFQENRDRLFRITSTAYRNGELRGKDMLTGYALGPLMKDQIPEVKTSIRTHPMYGGCILSYQPKSGDPVALFEENLQFVDSTFLHAFTYNAIQGDLKTALNNPTSIVITQSAAKKYFGDQDPMGKELSLVGWISGDLEVTAVIEDVPQNSHFQFDFLIPIHNLLRSGQYTRDDGWGWNNFVTYVELNPQADITATNEKLNDLFMKYRAEDLARSNSKVDLSIQPIEEIHLTPGFVNEMSATANVNTIYFFILISIFILAIAWVNYINLSTARAMERAREVGIKKAVGAFKSQLISQFMLESVVVNFVGVGLAVLLTVLLLPILSGIVGKHLTLDFSDYRVWVVLLGLFLAGALVSGGYPAFVLSSFRTTDILKGRPDKMSGGFSLRKALVVFQFASSLILIAGTFTIYRQIMHMRNLDKGLTIDQMLILDGPGIFDQGTGRQKLITLKNELKKISNVTEVATSAAIPGGGYNWGTGVRRDGTQREESKTAHIVWVDPDFVSTYGMTVLSGRNFNPEIKSDMESVLVNEAALSAFGLGTPEQALEERILLGSDTTRILGVLRNYNWNSLKEEVSPFILKADTISQRNITLHINGQNISETVKQVEAKYLEIFPGNPFNYYFLDDFFDKQYKDEQQFASIFSMFSILAIIIACLGLWGLASFNTAQRLKEISIRKVLGASVTSLVSLLSWQFFKLVLLACLVALPLTWFGMDKWLSGFAFRVGLEWDLFVIPVVALSILALGTVSFHIIRGTMVNPASTLRSE